MKTTVFYFDELPLKLI